MKKWLGVGFWKKGGRLMLIPLKEYAERLGKNPDNARHLAQRGSFASAGLIGA